MRYPNTITIEREDIAGRPHTLEAQEARGWYDTLRDNVEGDIISVVCEQFPHRDKYANHRITKLQTGDPFTCYLSFVNHTVESRMTFHRQADGTLEHRPGLPAERKDDGSYYVVIDGPVGIEPPTKTLAFGELSEWLEDRQAAGFGVEITKFPATKVTLPLSQ